MENIHSDARMESVKRSLRFLSVFNMRVPKSTDELFNRILDTRRSYDIKNSRSSSLYFINLSFHRHFFFGFYFFTYFYVTIFFFSFEIIRKF